MFTNKENSKGSVLRRPVAIAAMIGLAATMAVGIGVSSASAATLTNVALSLSNNQIYAANVTYTAQFTTATAGTVASIWINVPTFSGTVGVGTVYGVGAGAASFTVGGTNTLVYTVTSPQVIAAGTPIYIEFTGITNGSNYGAWNAGMATNTAAAATIDNGVSANGLSFGNNNTAATLAVAKSLSFTNDTPSYTLLMDPSLAALSDLSKTVNLGVKTNAGQGYTLSMKDTGLKNAGTGAGAYTIPASANSTVTAFAATANQFGVTATSTSLNSLVVLASTYSGANISGYSTAGATIVTATKPTGNTADVIALANRVKIDYTTPAGTYTDTITYTATPAY